MPVLTFSLGPLETNCHLYQNGTDALIIDPSGHMVDILTEIKNKKLKINSRYMNKVKESRLCCQHEKNDDPFTLLSL